MPCTVLPVRDDLSGWCTMSHLKQKENTNKLVYPWTKLLIKKNALKNTNYPGKICQPGNGSCGWGRFSWYGNGAVNRPSLLHWPVPAVGTYVHGATGPAAAEWVCASQGQLLDLLTHHQPQVPCPLSLPVAAAGAAREQQNSIRFLCQY